MKRYLFLIALLLISNVWFGEAKTKKFKQDLAIGASFGMNFSSISFTPKVNQSMHQGFQGGLSLRWITEKHLGLQAELNFTQMGWKEEFEEQPEFEYSRTINYIDMPFLTHIYFGSDKFRVFVNLGPKVGFSIGESTNSNLNGAEPNRNNMQHDMPIQKKFDWGLCGGPGIELATGIGHFLLEGRYYYALGDIYNSQKKDPFARSASQVISVKLTYLFSLWKK